MIYIIIYLYVIGVLATITIDYPRNSLAWFFAINWFIFIPVAFIWAILKKEQ